MKETSKQMLTLIDEGSSSISVIDFTLYEFVYKTSSTWKFKTNMDYHMIFICLYKVGDRRNILIPSIILTNKNINRPKINIKWPQIKYFNSIYTIVNMIFVCRLWSHFFLPTMDLMEWRWYMHLGFEVVCLFVRVSVTTFLKNY